MENGVSGPHGLPALSIVRSQDPGNVIILNQKEEERNVQVQLQRIPSVLGGNVKVTQLLFSTVMYLYYI